MYIPSKNHCYQYTDRIMCSSFHYNFCNQNTAFDQFILSYKRQISEVLRSQSVKLSQIHNDYRSSLGYIGPTRIKIRVIVAYRCINLNSYTLPLLIFDTKHKCPNSTPNFHGQLTLHQSHVNQIIYSCMLLIAYHNGMLLYALSNLRSNKVQNI